MSTNIFWRPDTDKGREIPSLAPETLLKLLGAKQTPWKLDEKDVRVLKGVVRCLRTLREILRLDDEMEKEVITVIQAIETHGPIVIEVEY